MGKEIISVGLVAVSLILLLVTSLLVYREWAPEDDSAASIYYVSPTGNDNNAGTSVNPWKTFAKANSKILPGDTVILKNGIYREVLTISVANTTWKSETKHKAIIDGGFPPSLLSGDWNNIVTQWNNKCKSIGEYAPLVTFTNLSNVTIDGLYIRYSCGRGISFSTSGNSGKSDNNEIKNNKIDWTFNSSIFARPEIIDGVYPNQMNNNKFLDNTILRASFGDEYNVRVEGACGVPNVKKYCVNVSTSFGGNNTLVRGNIIAWGEGEVSPQPGSKNFIFENNVLIGNKNSFYAGMIEGSTVRNNLFYAPEEKKIAAGGTEDDVTNGEWRFGLRNEKGHLKMGKVPNTNILIYNNMIINTMFFIAGANSKYISNNNNIYFGNNTLVAGKDLTTILRITHSAVTGSGDPALTALFENNIIDTRKNPTSKINVKLSSNDKVTFRNNLWPLQNVPNTVKGGGDVYTNDPGLSNAVVMLNLKYPVIGPDEINVDELVTALNINNYRLVNGSKAVGTGTTAGSTIGVAIPTEARQIDYFRNNRVDVPDIGAVELSNNVTPTTSNSLNKSTSIVIRAKARNGLSVAGAWPKVELKIGNPTTVQPTVQTFTVNSTTYADYRYTHTVPVGISEIKVKLANGDGSVDVYIDKLTLGTTVYQTEDPTTLSTGTWNSSAGACVGGYYSTELLHCNGYFQYEAK